MNKQDDWLYVGAFVVRPDGFVDEVLSVSEDNGVRLKCSFQHYCRSQLKPFKSEAKTEWYDYDKQKPLALPPIGEKVNTVQTDDMVYGQDETNCEVVAHVEDVAVIRMSYGLGCFVKEALQPLDWDKLSKRKQAIAYAMELSPDWAKLEDIFGSLYDAGVLKLPEESR